MNAAQVHLALNHFPIAGIFLAALLLLLSYIFKKKELVLSGMVLVIVSGIMMIPMNASGDGTEDLVKNKLGVTRELIHAHEKAADKALIAMEATAILALGWFAANKKSKKIEGAVFFMSILSALLIADAAHKGGMIRHDEIRPQINKN